MVIVERLQYGFGRPRHCNKRKCRRWHRPNTRGLDLPERGGLSRISYWSLDQRGDASHGFGGSSWAPGLVWLQESETSSRSQWTGGPVIQALRGEVTVRWRMTDVSTPAEGRGKYSKIKMVSIFG